MTWLLLCPQQPFPLQYSQGIYPPSNLLRLLSSFCFVPFFISRNRTNRIPKTAPSREFQKDPLLMMISKSLPTTTPTLHARQQTTAITTPATFSNSPSSSSFNRFSDLFPLPTNTNANTSTSTSTPGLPSRRGISQVRLIRSLFKKVNSGTHLLFYLFICSGCKFCQSPLI